MARQQRLRRWSISALMILGIAWLALASVYPTARAESPYVAVATVDEVIDVVTTRYLQRVIVEAWDTDAVLLVVQLNTPGGLADSTRDIVGLILQSRVPVAVFVAPAGAQAASAGTFITAAAHFAVMAPATNIGAASPVTLGGDDVPDTLFRKVNEDTRAFIRSIAEAARSRCCRAGDHGYPRAVIHSPRGHGRRHRGPYRRRHRRPPAAG